jgi:probable selenium-dependent hydroxylase accessory protein YqeC
MVQRLSGLATTCALGPHELVSVVGGGGKTTVLFALAEQLSGSIVVTTTTKMHAGQTGGYRVLVGAERSEIETAASAGPPVVAWAATSGGKATGIDPATADSWFDVVDHVLVEADGSRMRPFKAPAPHEPVIPSRSTIVLSVIGADAIGRVIEDQCHRPLRVAALAGCSSYERLTPARAAMVLRHPDGGGRGVPPTARRIVLITKVAADNLTLVEELQAELGDLPSIAIAFEEGRR